MCDIFSVPCQLCACTYVTFTDFKALIVVLNSRFVVFLVFQKHIFGLFSKNILASIFLFSLKIAKKVFGQKSGLVTYKKRLHPFAA